jgi:vacuolar-type H+-ATPase subunit F/Vma7
LITKAAIIADKYLATGYRLAGIASFPVKSLAEARARLAEITTKGSYKIIFLPEKLAYQLREEREELSKIGGVKTLFVIVPDFHGPTGERTKELYQVISKAVGAKLKFEE